MPDVIARDLFDRFTDHSLPATQWDHHAHLTVCRVALEDRSPTTALAFLRDTIRRYNQATGRIDTADTGYHETLTVYYVGAVAALGDVPLDAVLTADSCARTAPFRHWSSELLFSRAARAAWVDPDLRPLPWDVRPLLSEQPAPVRRPSA
jgi:hypothetical protein